MGESVTFGKRSVQSSVSSGEGGGTALMEREPAGVLPQTKPESRDLSTPQMGTLQMRMEQAASLVDNIVMKNYLYNLNEYEIMPLDSDMKNIGDIRIFKITEMVYQGNEYSTYKFGSVFNSLQNLNCGIFIMADSDGEKTDYYMGVRKLDDQRSPSSLVNTLKSSLKGQFPGVKFDNIKEDDAKKLFKDISDSSSKISSVSCIARNKDEEFKNNDSFIQGLEKLSIAMQGQKYTAVILAKSASPEQLAQTRRAYETIYSDLSPFANMQLSYGKSNAVSISDSFSQSRTVGTTDTQSVSQTTGESYQKTTDESKSETKKGFLGKFIGSALLGVASLVTAPLTGGASIAAAGAIMAGQAALNSYDPSSKTTGTSTSESYSKNKSDTVGKSYSTSESETQGTTQTTGNTDSTNESIQLTRQNKTLSKILEKLDTQLKRIDECESLGMWECAAYFLSDSQETAEMAAGTYKALMKGENSGIETSAVNFWGTQKKDKLPALKESIMNFIHPTFIYRDGDVEVPVNAAALVSSNELAIHMGLPRKSVCGFPVIEHAEFGKEVVSLGKNKNGKEFTLGKVYSMGEVTNTRVKLNRDSLTMHTFVTGSTGSGKSNTVYELLNQMRLLYKVPFLVIEPAKGEYKNVFGNLSDVHVYGTNPKKSDVLKINPFRFNKDIHILEHLDRLVEIFGVCWPMYAAMPAILKDSMERAYKECGWDLITSENPNGDIYPNFSDLLNQIEAVVNESSYSSDSKGDYAGALMTRVRSLTTGINGMIFSRNDIPEKDMFDRSVVVDLSRVGSTETKALIMGLLVMKLNEYRMSSGKINSSLSHITVLEEAHNILKRTSTEQSAEGSNLLGKSVELLANSIAEMRTYGEGFIIADQSPGLMDMSAIRNTNTKIILRLPDRSDRELVGFAAGLSEEQIEELSKLGRGVAAVYQSDWVEPVLVQVDKCELEEKPYEYKPSTELISPKNARTQIVNLLIKGRASSELQFDMDFDSPDKMKEYCDLLGLNTDRYRKVIELINEYDKSGRLRLWEGDENFALTAELVTDILGIRQMITKLFSQAKVMSSSEITKNVAEKIKAVVEICDTSKTNELLWIITDCIMKDASMQGRNEKYNEVYRKWKESVYMKNDIL